jgi:succinate dehydrogenase flavin-adding protein (antitoxin of CptAB toxin-antitoxin module)
MTIELQTIEDYIRENWDSYERDNFIAFSVLLPIDDGDELKWVGDAWESLATNNSDTKIWKIVSRFTKRTLSSTLGELLFDLPEAVATKEGFFIHSPGCPEIAASFIRTWLRRFHPNHFLTFEVAHYSSTPEEGGFGGAVYYIDAKKIQLKSTVNVEETAITRAVRKGKLRFLVEGHPV